MRWILSVAAAVTVFKIGEKTTKKPVLFLQDLSALSDVSLADHTLIVTNDIRYKDAVHEISREEWERQRSKFRETDKFSRI